MDRLCDALFLSAAAREKDDNLGQWDKASAQYAKAIEFGTDYPRPFRPRQFAERAASAPSYNNYDKLSARGGVLYRAGHFEEAVRRLREADAVQPPEGAATHAFWLAMCHARLGHVEEAQQWLGKANQWLDQSLQRKPEDNPLPWDQRGILQRLRREAEALLGPPPGSDAGEP